MTPASLFSLAAVPAAFPYPFQKHGFAKCGSARSDSALHGLKLGSPYLGEDCGAT
jgi:hypothetical protein